MATNPKPSRRTTATNALALVASGAIILALLVRWSDNAYIGLGLIGLALPASAVPFLVATALPARFLRRTVFYLGIFATWAIALLSTAYLVYTIVGIRSIASYGSSVLINHALALPLVLVSAYIVGYRSWRR